MVKNEKERRGSPLHRKYLLINEKKISILLCIELQQYGHMFIYKNQQQERILKH